MIEKRTGILLNSHFTNKMAVNGELGWLLREFNASTGYTWRFTPDNSGVYELVEEITLHPSTEATGVPGMMIWKFKGIKAGKGSILLELYPPAATSAVETTTITITLE
ncbi:protease inhibitor I42 family protein [Roseofilum sp. Guam]|uniref:protease inhibitor I42 family protein n=1 Tax=Roseofilum sp. Guam TaxID=2821502 RepID=UPI001B28A63B|nr:protease inhibitor I42 family protein [Roseofilum sp. Guam]MBP0029432.1 protease inhibitor I42 family protein [Roseofilum sp. Guam]